MVLQKAVKSYPLVKWLLGGSAVLLILGLVLSGVLTTPDDAQPMTLVYFVIGAAVLPFIAMAFPRRQVVTLELPSDHLTSMSRTELEGVLQQLEAAKTKGDLDQKRYVNARQRVLDAIKAKGK